MPTPYDHFRRHLAREDNNVFKIPKSILERDTTQPHDVNPDMVASLEQCSTASTTTPAHGQPERYYAQFRVAENLLEFDEKFSIWALPPRQDGRAA